MLDHQVLSLETLAAVRAAEGAGGVLEQLLLLDAVYLAVRVPEVVQHVHEHVPDLGLLVGVLLQVHLLLGVPEPVHRQILRLPAPLRVLLQLAPLDQDLPALPARADVLDVLGEVVRGQVLLGDGEPAQLAGGVLGVLGRGAAAGRGPQGLQDAALVRAQRHAGLQGLAAAALDADVLLHVVPVERLLGLVLQLVVVRGLVAVLLGHLDDVEVLQLGGRHVLRLHLDDHALALGRAAALLGRRLRLRRAGLPAAGRRGRVLGGLARVPSVFVCLRGAALGRLLLAALGLHAGVFAVADVHYPVVGPGVLVRVPVGAGQHVLVQQLLTAEPEAAAVAGEAPPEAPRHAFLRRGQFGHGALLAHVEQGLGKAAQRQGLLVRLSAVRGVHRGARLGTPPAGFAAAPRHGVLVHPDPEYHLAVLLAGRGGRTLGTRAVRVLYVFQAVGHVVQLQVVHGHLKLLETGGRGHNLP